VAGSVQNPLLQNRSPILVRLHRARVTNSARRLSGRDGCSEMRRSLRLGDDLIAVHRVNGGIAVSVKYNGRNGASDLARRSREIGPALPHSCEGRRYVAGIHTPIQSGRRWPRSPTVMLGAVLARSHMMRGNSVRYKLGCSLSYEIRSAATFIFNLRVARIASHQILGESLALTPPLERGVYTEPASSNRYFRVNVSPGMFARQRGWTYAFGRRPGSGTTDCGCYINRMKRGLLTAQWPAYLRNRSRRRACHAVLSASHCAHSSGVMRA
jgi:hypothetical protein